MPVLAALVLGLAVGSTATALLVAPKTGQVLRVATAGTIPVCPDGRPEPSAAAAVVGVDPEEPSSAEASTAPEQPEPERSVDAEAPPEPDAPDDELELVAVADPEGPPSEAFASPPLQFDDVEIDRVEGTRPWVVHRILRVETLEQVAYRYDATPQAVRRWNGLHPDSKPPAGLRVKLKARRVPPPRQRVRYTVQPSDTWWSIAVGHGIDSRELRAANWNAPRQLMGGETLTLWIDPAVYHWMHGDRPSLGDEDVPSSIRRGAVGVGSPWDGRLINGVQIPAGAGWRRKLMPSSYGTTHAVESLVTALQAFHATSGYERELQLGSMSWPHGGPMAGHRSHQTGRDLDIRLPLWARYSSRASIKPRRVDYQALWKLVVALADTGEVAIVFLDHELQRRLYKAATKLGVDEATLRRMIQWPRGRTAHAGLVRHEDGHQEHIHVRFRCGPYETECVAGNASLRDGG
jgi:murein endopeptidase